MSDTCFEIPEKFGYGPGVIVHTWAPGFLKGSPCCCGVQVFGPGGRGVPAPEQLTLEVSHA